MEPKTLEMSNKMNTTEGVRDFTYLRMKESLPEEYNRSVSVSREINRYRVKVLLGYKGLTEEYLFLVGRDITPPYKTNVSSLYLQSNAMGTYAIFFKRDVEEVLNSSFEDLPLLLGSESTKNLAEQRLERGY